MEDEKPMALALQLKLRKLGFEVEIVANGEEGLALLDTRKFNLILTDLMMPKMDGFGVLEALKAKADLTPTLVLTNLSQAEDEQRAKALGAKGFFVKSNTPLAAIVTAVQQFLH
jgi:CheY-like chemotaxis protein